MFVSEFVNLNINICVFGCKMESHITVEVFLYNVSRTKTMSSRSINEYDLEMFTKPKMFFFTTNWCQFKTI